MQFLSFQSTIMSTQISFTRLDRLASANDSSLRSRHGESGLSSFDENQGTKHMQIPLPTVAHEESQQYFT